MQPLRMTVVVAPVTEIAHSTRKSNYKLTYRLSFLWMKQSPLGLLRGWGGVNRQRGKPTPGGNTVCIIQPRHRRAQEPPSTRLHSVAPWTWHGAVEQIVTREPKAVVKHAFCVTYCFVVLKFKWNQNDLLSPFIIIVVSFS